MNRLPRDIIVDLAKQFCIANRDDDKKHIVDQLGLHPVNHALFINGITGFTDTNSVAYDYAIASYIDLTKWIN